MFKRTPYLFFAEQVPVGLSTEHLYAHICFVRFAHIFVNVTRLIIKYSLAIIIHEIIE